MRNSSTLILLALLVFFGFPVLSGEVYLPKNLSASQVGIFLGSVISYWIDVINYALRKLGYSISFILREVIA